MPLTLIVGYLGQRWSLNPMVTLQLSKWLDTVVLDSTGVTEKLSGLVPESIGWFGIVIGIVALGLGLAWVWNRYQQSQTYPLSSHLYRCFNTDTNAELQARSKASF